MDDAAEPVLGGPALAAPEAEKRLLRLVLLAIGALIAWLPLIGILGSLLVLVGAILVILGRHAFGPKHARNVGIAIALFVFGFLGALALAGAFVSSVTSAVALPAAEAEPAITGAFGGLLLGALILGVISGLSTVLFIWELLNGTGRALILLSYVVALLLAALIYAMIMPQLTPALSSMFAVSPPDPTSIVALDNQINNLRLLQALPALLEAGAAYVAWSRIDAGQIP